MKNKIIKLMSMATVMAAIGFHETEARVVLPPMIADGMVVQRGESVRLWGNADPGETVTARVDIKKSKPVSVTADSDGRWELQLPPLKAGGPYRITVSDIVLSDVLCGDVFLCSGQSNMELPVNRVTDMFAEEISSYTNESIRHFTIPQTTAFDGPCEKINGGEWKKCRLPEAMNFSALAYFFAKELNAMTGVPVGIVNASWGGTPVEAWMSEESISKWDVDHAKKKIYDSETYRADIKKLEAENYRYWNHVLNASDQGYTTGARWNDPALDDSDWNEVQLLGNWGADDRHQPINGSHWLRRHFTLTDQQSAMDAVLRLGCFEGADSAFVNGVFVGTVGYQYPPRIYNVPSSALKAGDNVVTVRGVSGGGYPRFVADKPYRLILGDGTSVDLNGRWLHRVGARMPQGPGMVFYHYTPTVLYNAMIAPIMKMAIAGAVWYQGESNVGNRHEYAPKLKAMINDWRKGFDRAELPFYIVELADFLHPSDTGGRGAWAQMRAIQASVAADDDNTSLVRNSDLGEWNDIHPLDKKTLGKRVAAAVLPSVQKIK